MVAIDEFASPGEGLRHLNVNAVEIILSRDFEAPAMDSKGKVALRSDDDAKAYKKHLDGLNIRPVAFLTACDFSKGTIDDNAMWVARAIELAALVGMPVIRIDSAMERERELDFGTRVDLFSKGLGAALDRTKGLNVAMGIENHGFQGHNLAFLLNVFKTVGSARLGSPMDTGNFYWRGYPLSEVYGILNILAPYTKHTHVKNIKYPEDKREIMREVGWEYGKYAAPIYEGDIDHAKVVKILAKAGYDYDICLEDESLESIHGEERISKIVKNVEHLKKGIEAAKS